MPTDADLAHSIWELIDRANSENDIKIQFSRRRSFRRHQKRSQNYFDSNIISNEKSNN
jgi:hypothetical protein